MEVRVSPRVQHLLHLLVDTLGPGVEPLDVVRVLRAGVVGPRVKPAPPPLFGVSCNQLGDYGATDCSRLPTRPTRQV